MDKQGQGTALRCLPCPCGHLPHRGGGGGSSQGGARRAHRGQPLLLEGHRGRCGGRGDKTVLYIGVV